MFTRQLKKKPLLAVLLSCAIGLTTISLAYSSNASGSKGDVARDAFAVFQSGPAMAPEAEVADLAIDVGTDATDRTQFRVLGAGLGTFHSRLVAFPARGGKNVCYSLLGARLEDPGMSYCYAPRSTHVPAPLLGERFSVVALESVTAAGLETQVFGIAEDSVARVRVDVAGTWREIPIRRNGFYLDLPAVAHSDVGLVEATLSDGSRQFHDIQSGS